MNTIIRRCVVFNVILSNSRVSLSCSCPFSRTLLYSLIFFFFYHVWCSCLRSSTRDTGEGKIEDIFLQDRAKVFHLSPCTFKSVLKPVTHLRERFRDFSLSLASTTKTLTQCFAVFSPMSPAGLCTCSCLSNTYSCFFHMSCFSVLGKDTQPKLASLHLYECACVC